MPTRTREELNRYLEKLARPYTSGLYILDILHDDWCPLATNGLAPRCICGPTVTLVEIGERGEPVNRKPLLVDGQRVS